MLTYTRNKLLTHVATIERNMTLQDALGAPSSDNWQTLSETRCLLSWAKSTGVRSENRTYVSANREVPIQEGGVLMPLGTDITENDRISNIVDENGNELADGLFEIEAVIPQTSHLEVSVTRAHLGV